MRKVVRIEGGHGIAVRLYVAVELDDDAFLTTKGNHGGYCEIMRVKDIRNTREVVAALGGLEVDLVMGGPPCHDLSGANSKRAAPENLWEDAACHAIDCLNIHYHGDINVADAKRRRDRDAVERARNRSSALRLEH